MWQGRLDDCSHARPGSPSGDGYRYDGRFFQATWFKICRKKIIGTGTDQLVLQRAGIEKADAFLALTQGDNTNIMAAQIAREVFNVPNVTTRIYDPIRADAYRELGIETLCTTTLAAGLLRAMITKDPQYDESVSILNALGRG